MIASVGITSNISSIFLIFSSARTFTLQTRHTLDVFPDSASISSAFEEYGSFLLHRNRRRFSIYLIQLCYLLEFVRLYSDSVLSDELRRYNGRQRSRVRLTSTQKQIFCHCCFLIYLRPIVLVAVHQITPRIYQDSSAFWPAKKPNLAESRVKFLRYAGALLLCVESDRCLTRSKIRMNIQ